MALSNVYCFESTMLLVDAMSTREGLGAIPKKGSGTK